MFYLKLSLEVCTALLAVFFIRKLFLRFSKRRKERNAVNSGIYSSIYYAIRMVCGIILTVTIFWLSYFVFNTIHHLGNFVDVLVINQVALLVPSMLIGFSLSDNLSGYLYLRVFEMNQEALNVEKTKKQGNSKWLAYGVRLSAWFLAVVLLVAQFNVYIKTDGKNIYARKFLQGEKIYSLTEIKKIHFTENGSGSRIELPDGESISMNLYSGDVTYFMDRVSR